MNKSLQFSIVFVLTVFFQGIYCPPALFAAPRSNVSYVDQNTTVINQVRSTVEGIRHDVSNHEIEMRVFDEKLQNLDLILESIREQLNDTSQSHRDQLKGSTTSLDSKISAQETLSKSLISDLKQFKTYANDNSIALSLYKQKLTDLERVVEQQNQSIAHLQAALKSVMEILQPKDPVKNTSEKPLPSGNAYKVKNGDSLEKIARANQTTVQILKELNGLTSDNIIVGKTLQLPEK